MHLNKSEFMVGIWGNVIFRQYMPLFIAGNTASSRINEQEIMEVRFVSFRLGQYSTVAGIRTSSEPLSPTKTLFIHPRSDRIPID